MGVVQERGQEGEERLECVRKRGDGLPGCELRLGGKVNLGERGMGAWGETALRTLSTARVCAARSYSSV